MTQPHDFNEDFNWSERPDIVKLSHDFLRSKFNTISNIEKMREQKNGDYVLYFHGGKTFRFTEVKTRKPDKLRFFEKDRKLMFEVISNGELNRYSSAISTSKSWWWCYLLTDIKPDGILFLAHGWVFWTRYLVEFIEKNQDRYLPLVPSRNKGYTTWNLLIDLADIEDLQVEYELYNEMS